MEETGRSATLYDLAPGQSGMIRAVGNQSGAVKRRLIDMGLTPGTRVTVNKIAPLGDPLEVSLRGYVLSVRGRWNPSPCPAPPDCRGKCRPV